MTEMGSRIYRAMGYGHATATRWFDAAVGSIRHDQRGQGTVEYIGLVLMLAAVMAVVVTTGNGKSIGLTVIKKVRDAIAAVGAT